MQKSKLQFKIQNYFLAILAMFILLPSAVFSAELRADAKSQEVNIGDQFQINVILNAKGEEINAIEGSVIFPSDLIALKEINDGNSVISLWIERPHERQGARNKEQGEIVFSGIIPGGYKETNGFIFSAFFTAKTSGKGIIEFRNVRAFKNDGLGTLVEMKISNFQFLISNQFSISQIPKPEVKDAESPESFTPEIAKDETLFDGKWFIVFATQDKASGIDRYEIKESRQKVLSVFKKWVTAKNPYILRDQELRSFVFVKAVDKASNERIIKITPRNPLAWFENYENWIIIIVGAAIIVLTFLKLIKSK